jgi:hypothetical protein
MSKFPRILTPCVIYDENKNVLDFPEDPDLDLYRIVAQDGTSALHLDITSMFLAGANHKLHGFGPLTWDDEASNTRYYDNHLRFFLSRLWKQTEKNLKIDLPKLNADIKAYTDQIQSLQHLKAIANRNRDINVTADRLATHKMTLAKVQAAKWEPDSSVFQHYYTAPGLYADNYMDNEFIANVDWAYQEYGMKPFRAKNPEPDYGAETRKAWEDAYAKARRLVTPPFVYGTTAISWSGLIAGDIRESYLNDAEFDIQEEISNSLEEHYEDAMDAVVDLDKIENFIKDWKVKNADYRQEVLKKTETGEWHSWPEPAVYPDLALDIFLESWNKSQSITSYYQDDTVITGVFTDATKEEAITFMDKVIQETETQLNDLKNNWSWVETADHAMSP